MRAAKIVIGACVGVAIGLGALVATDVASEAAEAQKGGQFVTKAEFEARDRANQRRIAAARRSAVNNFNLLGRFLAPRNEVIGVDTPEGVILQQRGTGDGGLPTEVIKDAAITAGKLAPGVQATLARNGPAGPVGPVGPAGPTGPQGPVGVSGYQLVPGQSDSSSDQPKDVVVECPEGKRVLGGGTSLGGTISNVVVAFQGPVGERQYFARAVEVVPGTASNWSLSVNVICADI